MFYYYDRKKQIAKHYPCPNYPAIVEPFAGSAAYSLYGNHWKKDVILVEKDEKVANIWQWLITEATRDRIQAMPDLEIGKKVLNFYRLFMLPLKWRFITKPSKSPRYSPEIGKSVKSIWPIMCIKLSIGR